MNKLEKQHLLKKENLNATHYFQSILQEAHRLKLLNDLELENIQLQCIQLLARRSERYSGGESSSVKIETAQGIMQSIFYTVGICLKRIPDTDASIEVLKKRPLSELYSQGKKLIETQMGKTKQLFKAVQDTNIATDNYAYNDTLQNGITIFFSTYDLDFAAHDTPAPIDYPISNEQSDLVGIEYMHSYLQNLFLENNFCRNFSVADIHCLLRGYDDHYQDLLINIFQIVLANALGCVLANKDVLQLNIEPLDRNYLQQKLVNLSKDKLDVLLQGASAQLCMALNITDRLLQKHITATVIDLSVRLKNALEKDQLESIFISLKENRAKPVLQFEEGKKMDDELFRSIVDEIKACRFASDKIAILQREVHSITDLIDILEGYCLFDGEFTEVFQSFEDMELALLFKKLPTFLIDSSFHVTENEKEWHNSLRSFFKEIDLTRSESIRALAEKISAG